MIARIGPNSPTAPAAMVKTPKWVGRMPRSRRIGSRVPIAVVVSTSPMRRPDSANPIATRNPPTASPSTSETTQPSMPASGRLAAQTLEVDLEAGDEEQHRDAELREPVDEAA